MKRKHLLLGGVSALAVGMLIAPTFAQDAMETVVVTGIRASLQSAQALKQNSDQVLESITAVDIGALPDSSVAEALQRVPGIQITRTDVVSDPLRWAGFGNGVFIRGLSWVKSLTNGEEIFGAADGRSISFADISSDLMAGVDVYKNPTAKQIEGGVGGTIDLKTRKPFDKDGQVVAISSNLSMGTLSYHATPAVNALYSNRFNTKIGEIGFLVSADYQDLMSSNNVVAVDPYDNHGTVNGLATSYPKGNTNNFGLFGYRHMDWKQPRVALDATVQWRPTDSLEIAFTTIYSKAEPQSNEHNVAWTIPGFASNSLGSSDEASRTKSLATYTYDKSGAWTGGTIYNAQANSSLANYFDTRFDARHHINKTFELNVKYNPTDNLQITIDGNYIDSRATMSSMTIYNMVKNNKYKQSGRYTNTSADYFYPNAQPVNLNVNIRGNAPIIDYDDTAFDILGDKSNYLWAAAMDHYENNYAHAYVTRADATYTFDGSGLLGWVKSIDLGARTNMKQAVTRNSGWNWGRIGFETWNTSSCGRVGYSSNTIPASTCASVVGDFSTWMSNYTTLYKSPDVFGSKVPGIWEPNMSWMKNPYNVWSSVQTMEAAYKQLTYVDGNGVTQSLGNGMWTPLIAKNGANCSGVAYTCQAIYNGAAGATSGVSDQFENTYAGYLQANYIHETFLGYDVPVDGNIGVRIVNTQYDSGEGYLKLPTMYTCSVANCTDYNEALAFVGTGNGTVVFYPGVKHSYTNVLPSFNFRLHPSDNIQFRAAYSQGLVRPDLDKMRNYSSVGFAWGTGDLGGTFAPTNAKSGSGSNPNLKPMYSQNYDVSLEWYFSQTGNVSLALFHKVISNYVMSGSVNRSLTRNGITEDFNVTTYVNGDAGKVEGFEFAYQQFFDQLPGAFSGLGVQANYTKIYNSGGHNSVSDPTNTGAVANAANTALPMEGMSSDSYNAALMYEKYGISGRVAYNWRSRFLVSSYATNLNEPVWQRSYGQVDTSLLYNFMDHYKLGVQVNNLFKQTTILQVGTTTFHPNYEWVEGERKLSLILRASW